jgi:hypothetical protein
VAVRRPARTAYGVPASDVYGDWAPTEEAPEGEEGGWGDVEEGVPQQTLVGRIQGMLMGLVSMLPQMPAGPSSEAHPDQATLTAAAEEDVARENVQVCTALHSANPTMKPSGHRH